MDLLGLCRMLDDEFAVAQNQENLVEWAVTKENEEFVYPDFLGRKTGLMVKGSETVRKVFTAVFVTDNVVRKVSAEENGVLFTHHQFNYYEDERGLQPIAPGSLDTLIRSDNSVYVAHASLDTHKKYGTSLSLAKLIGVQVDQFFYDYFGAPTALIGHIARMSIDDFANHIQKRLRRPSLTVHSTNPLLNASLYWLGRGTCLKSSSMLMTMGATRCSLAQSSIDGESLSSRSSTRSFTTLTTLSNLTWWAAHISVRRGLHY